MKDKLRILYLARHSNPLSNDDEGGITGNLRELGHEVECIQESKIQILERSSIKADFILYHHCKSLTALTKSPIPKVFWCFDRIYWNDTKLATRNATRMEWITKATEISEIGFCTDGDWVNRDNTGKLVWLMQGFNQYLPRVKNINTSSSKILFTGGGRDYGRDAFVTEMRQRYGDRFIHIPKGAYRQNLVSLIEDSAIVVAPPTPVTNRYWSNRVYVIMGMGGFLLHPTTQGLEQDFDADVGDLNFYGSMQDLHECIRYFTYKGNHEIEEFRKYGQEQVLTHHTYKNRCQTLITTVRERLEI